MKKDPLSYHELIQNILKKQPTHFREDMYQDLMEITIGICNNWEGSDEHLEFYLMSTLSRRAKDLYRSYQSPRNMELSMDDMTLNQDGESVPFSETYIDPVDHEAQMDAAIDIDLLRGIIPPRDFRVIELSYMGYKAEEIVQEFPELEIKSLNTIYTILKKYADD